jgi:large subunit ribosomal protein L22
MIITAQATNIRTSPRKLRLVADMIRPLSPERAILVLKQTNKRAGAVLAKVIKQALANASNNFKLNKSDLEFKSVEVNGGPTYKRWMAASKGRGHSIMKRTSHIKIVLENKEVKKESKKAESIKKEKPASIRKTKSTRGK